MDTQEFLKTMTRLPFYILQVVYWYLEAFYRKFVPPPMKSIDGEIILVTGAAGGIGKEICRHLVRSGSNLKLILWDLNKDELEKLEVELKEMRRDLKVFACQVDVSSKDNIEAESKKIQELIGPVTIIFNNAGIVHSGNFLQQSNSQIENTININLMSQIWIIRQFLPDMIHMDHGRIVCTASMLCVQAGPHIFPYIVSKFGLSGMMEALKTELSVLKCDGVHCTTVYPYAVKTPLLKALFYEGNSGTTVMNRAFRMLEPQEVAESAVEGMRREYEKVYVPRYGPFVTSFINSAPSKISKVIWDSFYRGFLNLDTKEHQRLQSPF